MKYTLHGNWTLDFTMPKTGEHKTLDAKVPSNFEHTLMEYGILGDILPADNLRATIDFETVDDWCYTKTFDKPSFTDSETCELVFEGIDTIADIYLNGKNIYAARSMHMEHRIDVSDKLKDKDNILQVIIRSAVLYDYDHIERGNALVFTHPDCNSSYLRKAKHEFGWDNSPRLITGGIFRPVYLEVLPGERFSSVYHATLNILNDVATLFIGWDYLTPSKHFGGTYTVHYVLSAEGKVIREEVREVFFPKGVIILNVPLNELRLWWPRGFGEQFMHDFKIEMQKDGKTVAEWESKWGIRTVRLDYTKHVDKDGNGKFQFYVNNKKIYINGTNWKPLSPLHSEADALVEKALDLADDLHCNMIRVWGGGIYEGKEFFDYCDTHGILVWQDFMFGCEIPPVEEEYLELCREETINVIKRIRNHPSLAVFCGDNENDMFLANRFRGLVPPSFQKLTREILPACVYSYAPAVSYVESSPVRSDEETKAMASGSTEFVSSEAHFYRNIKMNYEGIRACRSLFIGETGPIGTNPFTDNMRIYEREKARLERLWNTPTPMTMIDMHQHDSYLINKLRYGADICKIWFDKEFSFEQYFDFAFGVNIICSNLYKDIIELCRTSRWDKTGVIWWSLLDMWPMICNYSVVDSDFRPKLPYYWIKQAQQPSMLAAVRKKVGGEMALYYANDTLETHNVSFKITAYTAEGDTYSVASGSCEMKPNEAEKLLPLPKTDKTELWLIEWRENGKTYYNHIFTSDQHADFDVYKKWVEILKPLYGIK